MPKSRNAKNSSKIRPKPFRRKAKKAATNKVPVGRPSKVDLQKLYFLCNIADYSTDHKPLTNIEIARILSEVEKTDISRQSVEYALKKLNERNGYRIQSWVPIRLLFSGVGYAETHPKDLQEFYLAFSKRPASSTRPSVPRISQEQRFAIFSVRAETDSDGNQGFAYTGKQIIARALPGGALGQAIRDVLPIPEAGIVLTIENESWYVIDQTSRRVRGFFKKSKGKRDGDEIRRLAQEAAGGGLTDEFRDAQAANAKFGGK